VECDFVSMSEWFLMFFQVPAVKEQIYRKHVPIDKASHHNPQDEFSASITVTTSNLVMYNI